MRASVFFCFSLSPSHYRVRLALIFRIIFRDQLRCGITIWTLSSLPVTQECGIPPLLHRQKHWERIINISGIEDVWLRDLETHKEGGNKGQSGAFKETLPTAQSIHCPQRQTSSSLFASLHVSDPVERWNINSFLICDECLWSFKWRNVSFGTPKQFENGLGYRAVDLCHIEYWEGASSPLAVL